MTTVVLVRHGSTEWSEQQRHTGRTDLPLSRAGERQAAALAPTLSEFRSQPSARVLCSPLLRARQTADLAGLTLYDVDGDLVEWDYGEYEGLTTAQIREQVPGWTVFTSPCPGGEPAAEVGARCDRVIARVESELGPEGLVLLVAHGHLLRSLAARWLGRPVSDGALLELGTGSVSTLGHEHGVRTIRHWNLPNPLA